VPAPKFLADEMVGRLARYLRFVGCDTVYVRGLSDDEILHRLRDDPRMLLTRDRALARRASSALLLVSPSLEAQWRAVRHELPHLPTEVRFERCSLCNGRLEPASPSRIAVRSEGVPWDRVDAGLPLFACADCGHLYWDGSHTARIRRQIEAWNQDGAT